MLSISGISKRSTLPASGVTTYFSAAPDVRLALAKGLDKYDLVKLLGYGYSSKVYAARRYEVKDGHPVFHSTCAIKVVNKCALGESHEELTSNEAAVLLKLRETGHMCFVQLEETMADPVNRYLVMERLDGGSLFDMMERECGPLDPTFVRMITAELVVALLHLKRHGVIHRDIKPENILLTARGRAVLADFGVAADLFKTTDGRARGACGTPGYMAPEVMLRLPYSHEVDMWSLGCTLYQLLVGYIPFEGKDYEDCLRRTITEQVKYPELKQGLCYYTRHFLSNLLDRSPLKRLRIEDAHETAYLEGIDWQRVEKGDYELPEEWLPPQDPIIRGHALDKEVLGGDIGDGHCLPWSESACANDINFVTPLHAGAGRREREEAEMAYCSGDDDPERDASLLFAMPYDDLPDEFMEGASSSGFGYADLDQEPELLRSSFGRTSLQSPVQCMGGWPMPERDIGDGCPQSSVQLHPALISAELVAVAIVETASIDQEVDLADEDDLNLDSPILGMVVPSMPPFVPRNIPDPFGEIPAHFTEEQVRACEADLIYIREYCTRRGVRGLGLRNVPELVLTMSTATLASAPVTPLCTWWPPVAPVKFEPRAPSPERREPVLPMGMRMRLFISDVSRALRRAFIGSDNEKD